MKKGYNLKIKPSPGLGAEVAQEVYEIKKAIKNVDQIKAGNLKGRPAEELLNEL